MKISAKSRYGLAAMIRLAQSNEGSEKTSIFNLSEGLGMSKIYLEQVFSLLKRAGLVSSIKGSHGGYKLAKRPEQINVYDIFLSIETSLFDPTEATVEEKAPEIEQVMGSKVFDLLDKEMKSILEQILLSDLVTEVTHLTVAEQDMYYI